MGEVRLSASGQRLTIRKENNEILQLQEGNNKTFVQKMKQRWPVLKLISCDWGKSSEFNVRNMIRLNNNVYVLNK